MDKKKLYWSLISIFIAILSISAVLSQDKTFSLREFCQFVQSANNFILFLAAVCMCGYFFFEGLAIARMANILGYSNKKTGLVYGAADVYFSAITPSASGGQPASAYFMIWDGIPTSATTAILLVNLIMYTLALLCTSLISLTTHWHLFLQYSTLSKVLIICGGVLMLGLTVCFFLLLRRASLLYGICNYFLKILERIKLVKKADSLREKLEVTMDDYRSCSDLLFNQKKRVLAEVFLWNLLQRLSLLAVSALVYLSFGYGFSVARTVWHIQNFTVLGSNCIPSPGAMGVADYLMFNGYTILLGDEEFAVSMVLLCRGISFYGCIITSGLIVLIGYIYRKIKEQKC